MESLREAYLGDAGIEPESQPAYDRAVSMLKAILPILTEHDAHRLLQRAQDDEHEQHTDAKHKYANASEIGIAVARAADAYFADRSAKVSGRSPADPSSLFSFPSYALSIPVAVCLTIVASSFLLCHRCC